MTWIVRSAPIVTWHFKGWWLDNSWQMALDTFFRHFAKLREVLRNLRIYCMYCTSTLGKLCGQDCFILDFGLSRGRRIDVIWQAWHGLFDIHNLQAQHAEYRGARWENVPTFTTRCTALKKRITADAAFSRWLATECLWRYTPPENYRKTMEPQPLESMYLLLRMVTFHCCHVSFLEMFVPFGGRLKPGIHDGPWWSGVGKASNRTPKYYYKQRCHKSESWC